MNIKRTLYRSVLMTMLYIIVSGFIGVLCAAAGEEPKGTDNGDAIHTIVPPDAEFRLLLDGTAEKPGLTFTEGPSWMNGKLYFSNYYMFWKEWGSSDEGGLIVIDPDGAHRVLNKNIQTCGTIPMASGNLAVCDLRARSIVEIDPRGTVLRTLADSFEGSHLGMPNDIVVDSKGGIYFTDPNNGPKKAKKLRGNTIFYLNPKGKLMRVAGWNDFGFPNGCVLSPDGRYFYVDDSETTRVWVYDVGEDGALSNRRQFAELRLPKELLKEKNPRSNADGMTVDMLGNVYVAVPMGVQVFDKTGGYIGVIVFPGPPSNCIFGGEDMKTLFATCRDRIYSVRTNVAGLAYPPEK
ncbi:SMP-30/gluconolactonase/LRE family protein [bacterium]|nr:SMP-30/gluconolactonase/LRE family protein [bacterium]